MRVVQSGAVRNRLGSPKTWTDTSGIRSCAASLTAGNHKATQTITDTTDPDTGTATYRCWDGSWQEQSAGCGARCTTQSVSWKGGGTCDGSLTDAISGQSSTITDSTGNTRGSATYRCDNGVWLERTGSCDRVCAAQNITWTQSGNSCDSSLIETTSGKSRTIEDRDGNTRGNATYRCNNGVWVQGNVKCGRVCASKSVSWTDGSNTCHGSLNEAVSGNTETATDNDAGSDNSGTTGTATYRCNNGTWQESSSSCSSGSSGSGSGSNSGGGCSGTPQCGSSAGGCDKGSNTQSYGYYSTNPFGRETWSCRCGSETTSCCGSGSSNSGSASTPSSPSVTPGIGSCSVSPSDSDSGYYSYQCRKDSGSWSSCGTFSGLSSNASYSFSMRRRGSSCGAPTGWSSASSSSSCRPGEATNPRVPQPYDCNVVCGPYSSYSYCNQSSFCGGEIYGAPRGTSRCISCAIRKCGYNYGARCRTLTVTSTSCTHHGQC